MSAEAEASAAVRAALAEVGLTVVDEHARELPTGSYTGLVRLDVTSASGSPGAVSVRHSPRDLHGPRAPVEAAPIGDVWTSWFGASMALDEWSPTEVRHVLEPDLGTLEVGSAGVPSTNADSRLVAAVLAHPAVRALVGERPRRTPARALLMAAGFEEAAIETLLSPESPPWRFEAARPVLTALADGAPLDWVLRRHGGSS